jgi:hypothetical protein
LFRPTVNVYAAAGDAVRVCNARTVKDYRSRGLAVLESISDIYLFGRCISLSALLIAPLARVEGAEDALTKFLIKRERALRKPQPARPQLALAARMRGRKPRADQQPARPNRRKQPAVAKKIAKRRAT